MSLNILPTNYTVSISRASGELDEWGLPITSNDKKAVPCLLRYNTLNEQIAVASGEQVTFTATLLFFDFIEVTFADEFEWIDLLGNVVTKSPISIDYKMDLSGKPIALRVVV